MNYTSSATTLKKLWKCEGEWILEMERLVRMGNFLQPVPQIIVGQNFIGRHLREVAALSSMAEATEVMMIDDDNASLASYKMWEGKWIDEDMAVSLSQSPQEWAQRGGSAKHLHPSSTRSTGAPPQIGEQDAALRLSVLEKKSRDLHVECTRMHTLLLNMTEQLKTMTNQDSDGHEPSKRLQDTAASNGDEGAMGPDVSVFPTDSDSVSCESGAIADAPGAIADAPGAIADAPGAIADAPGAIADAPGAPEEFEDVSSNSLSE